MCKVIGILLFPGHSTADRNLGYLIYSSTVKLMIAMLICSEIWYTLTKSSSMDELVGNINTTFIQFIAIYRYKNMVSNSYKYSMWSTDKKILIRLVPLQYTYTLMDNPQNLTESSYNFPKFCHSLCVP